MLFKVVSSGSIGNAYILEAKEESIILECGVPISKIKKSIDFNLSKVKGVLITHQHLDHSKAIKSVCDAAINVYCLKETAEAFGFKSHRINTIHNTQQFQVGGFKIKAFPLIHDVPTIGFLIEHEESGRVCFITDTMYCKYTFPKLNNIIIEANYCEDIMTRRFLEGSLNGVVRNRTMHSHMSFQNTLEFLGANDLTEVNKIILIHLSSGNADEAEFQNKARDFTGKAIDVARPGREFQVTKTPIF